MRSFHIGWGSTAQLLTWTAGLVLLPVRPHAMTTGEEAERNAQGRRPSASRCIQAAEPRPDCLSETDWIGIRAALQRCQYEAIAAGDGFVARNPGQQWSIHFDGRGVAAQPSTGEWSWGLQLERYGWPGNERTICNTPRVDTNGQRVTYDWDDTLQEWWVNDIRGLEHGYTLSQRPPISGAGPLTITLAIRGDLQPCIQPGAQGVGFSNLQGGEVLVYSGLVVTDSDGATIAAHFELADGGLRLCIYEGSARYPLTVDPIAQQAYVKASNSASNDNFGLSVAISGDTAVVGAPGEDSASTGVNGNQTDNSASGSGAAYVFVRSGTSWSQQAYLKASNTAAGDAFGSAVSISADTIVIGAPGEDSATNMVNGDETDNSAADAGAAY